MRCLTHLGFTFPMCRAEGGTRRKQRSCRSHSRCLLWGGSSAHAASLQTGSGVNKYIIPHCLCHHFCPKHQLLLFVVGFGFFFSLIYIITYTHYLPDIPISSSFQDCFSCCLKLHSQSQSLWETLRGFLPAQRFYTGLFLLKRYQQFLHTGENEHTEHPNQLTRWLKESGEHGMNTEL